MSKSMAIPSVMNIFLMIAVLIVGVSFLLQAFGIDIIGWLKGQFGGFEIPKDGKILYFKADPPDDKEIWSMYLTDEPAQKIEHTNLGTITFVGESYFAYFAVNNNPSTNLLYKNNCIVYTVDEAGGHNKDEAFIYYAIPGTTIQNEGCDSLGECLAGKTADSGCVGKGKDVGCTYNSRGPNTDELKTCYEDEKGTFVTVNCFCAGVGDIVEDARCDDQPREIESLEFGDEIKRKGDCELDDGRPKNPSKCNLLVPENTYTIRYGLLCGDDERWHTCKKDVKPVPANGLQYTCQPTEGENIFIWKPPEEQTATKIECDLENCIFDKERGFGTVAVCGKLLTTNDHKISNKYLKLVKRETEERAGEILLPVKNNDGSDLILGPTDENGRACTFWQPPGEYSGLNQYKVLFDGDSLLSSSNSRTVSLTLESAVTLYDGTSFRGTSRKIVANTPNLGSFVINFDNLASSAKIKAGFITTLYEGPDYKNDCRAHYAHPSGDLELTSLRLDNSISSIKIWKDFKGAILYHSFDFLDGQDSEYFEGEVRTFSGTCIGSGGISSIKVALGYKATICALEDLKGICKEITGDNNNLENVEVEGFDFNDKVRSIKIEPA